MNGTSEHVPSSDHLSLAERFTWSLLGDLVFEDSYALWEAILSSDPMLKPIPSSEARALSAQAVLDLLEREWIYLFRLEGLDPNDAFKRPDLRLTLAEAQDCVSRIVQSGEPMGDVWMAPTEAGSEAANDPPSAVRRLWGWEGGASATD